MYANPANLTDDAIDCYLTPILGSAARRAQLIATCARSAACDRACVESFPRAVRMVWGTADIHFDASWAHCLDRTFPRSRGVRRVDGAKLLFPEELPALISDEARAQWR